MVFLIYLGFSNFLLFGVYPLRYLGLRLFSSVFLSKSRYAKGDFQGAVDEFQRSLQLNRNDPESLIYYNNSKAALAGKPLKIAVSVPIGTNLNVAQEILRGVAQAQNEVNARGGIKGKLLEVAIANDDNQPELVKKIADAFVRDKQVLAVIGHNASDASVAAAPIYEEGKLVMLTPTSFSDNLVYIGDYILRMTPSISFFANKLYSYIRQTNPHPKIGICYDSKANDNTWFVDRFKQAVENNGGNLSDVFCDLAANDFNSKVAIAKMKEQKVNALLLAPHVDRIPKAIDVAKANQGQIPLFGSLTLYTLQTLQLGRKDINNLVITVPWHPYALVNSSFPEDAYHLWGGRVTWRTAMAYDAAKTLTVALKDSQTRETLKSSLKSSKFSLREGVASGEVKFETSGERRIVAETVNLVRVEPSKTFAVGYDFVLMR